MVSKKRNYVLLISVLAIVLGAFLVWAAFSVGDGVKVDSPVAGAEFFC